MSYCIQEGLKDLVNGRQRHRSRCHQKQTILESKLIGHIKFKECEREREWQTNRKKNKQTSEMCDQMMKTNSNSMMKVKSASATNHRMQDKITDTQSIRTEMSMYNDHGSIQIKNYEK